MYRFFREITAPLLERSSPSVVVEIGVAEGRQTELLAPWCAEHHVQLHCIDPMPKCDVDEWKRRWPNTINFHLDLSLRALEQIGPADAVLIDGDHNWYTVLHELRSVHRMAGEAGKPFPLVLLHDVTWPYGRRDLYYAPETVPAEFRNPCRRGGMNPARAQLDEHGYNDHLDNALDEGTPRNGVLTAVEDFLAETGSGLRLAVLPVIHGLGIVYDHTRSSEVTQFVEETLASRQGLERVMRMVEDDRLSGLLDISRLARDLRDTREHRNALKAELGTALGQVRERSTQLTESGAQISTLERAAAERERVSAAMVKEHELLRQELEAERLRRSREVELLERAAADREQASAAMMKQLGELEQELTLERRWREREAVRRRALQKQLRDLREKMCTLRGRKSVRVALWMARRFGRATRRRTKAQPAPFGSA